MLPSYRPPSPEATSSEADAGDLGAEPPTDFGAPLVAGDDRPGGPSFVEVRFISKFGDRERVSRYDLCVVLGAHEALAVDVAGEQRRFECHGHPCPDDVVGARVEALDLVGALKM